MRCLTKKYIVNFMFAFVLLFAGIFSACEQSLGNKNSADVGSGTNQNEISYALSTDGAYYKVVEVNKKLTSVDIPTSHANLPVKEISDSAFSGCEKLEQVTIPDSITTIGPSVFKGCKARTENTCPNTWVLLQCKTK